MMLLVGRIVAGFCSGVNVALVSIYINEMSPDSMRGRTGAFNQLYITIGILATSVMGNRLKPGEKGGDPSLWLYIMFGLPLLTCLLRSLLLLTSYNYDTPKFYILKNDRTKALYVLDKIYVNNSIVEKKFQLIS